MLKPGLPNSAPFGNATSNALPHSTAEFDQVAQDVIKDLQDGTRSFLSAAKGIKAIHDQKLYLSRYATFEEYCEKHFQISRSFA